MLRCLPAETLAFFSGVHGTGPRDRGLELCQDMLKPIKTPFSCLTQRVYVSLSEFAQPARLYYVVGSAGRSLNLFQHVVTQLDRHLVMSSCDH